MGDLKRLLSNQIKDTVNLLACICYKGFTPKLFQASTSHLTLENISEKLVDLFQNFTLDFFWYLVELFVVLEIYVGQACSTFCQLTASRQCTGINYVHP